MFLTRKYALLSVFCCFSIIPSALAQNAKPLTRILFIFDASNSMNGKWQSATKRDVAKRLLSEALDSLSFEDDLELAFRVYGHQKSFPPQDCDDTKLEVPFGRGNTGQIKKRLKEIKPRGTTPIAMTLERSADDFPPCADCRNIIILITDGVEECNGDPCAVSRMLQSKGIILKPFVIGVGLDVEFKKTFECVGNYFDATNESTFKSVLNIVISQALNSTTAQVNLLDLGGLPIETDVNMTFYNRATSAIEYNFIHTINNRGVPDTIPLDPVPTYRMVAHTIPPVELDSFRLVPGTHNVIALDAPQGILDLRIAKNVDAKGLKAIVRKSGEMETLHIHEFGTKVKYLVGKYDLEILTLPRTYIENVNILQSHTAKVEIQESGIATISRSTPGFGSVYKEENNWLKWVCNLDETLTRETFKLQPGNYRVVFRSKAAKEVIYSKEKSFKVRSGSSTSIKVI